MGGFLSEIRGKSVAVDCGLLNSTHSKLIEYYSSYKSICDGFTINIPEYTQIFGASQLSFAVWDGRGRGKIDAIEMFAGLVVFSRIRYEQKIKFLFEIFDFNEEGFLFYENLAFLLLNVCNATYKLLALQRTLPQSSLEAFLDDYFTHDSKIRLPQLLRWTTKNRAVLEYFQQIGYEVEQPPDDRRIDAYTPEQGIVRKKKHPRVYTADKDFRLDNKLVSSLESLLDKRQVSELEMFNLQLQWLYGMDVGRQNIRFVRVQGQKAGNERIIYSVGKVVVIYFPKLNAQRYYKGHTQPIGVIQISKKNRLAASAQSGEYPAIHIWDVETRLNLIKFKRIHKYSIKFLKFFNSDRYLVTASESAKVGGTIESPVIVLKLDSKEVIMSTYLKVDLIGISNSAASDKDASAYLIGKSSITILNQSNRAFNVQRFDLKGQKSQVKDIIAYAFHPKGILFTAHRGRQLYRWDEKYNCTLIKYQSLSIAEILQIAIIGDDQLLVMDQFDIQMINIKESFQLKRKRMLGLPQTKLYNLNLFSMQVIQGNKLFVISQFGDVIKISDIDLRQIRFQRYYQLFKMEDVSDIFLINSNNIVFVSSRFLYAVDRHEKQLKILSKFDFELQLSDVYKQHMITITVALQSKTSNLTLLSLTDYTARENYKLNHIIEDVKITESYVLAISEIFLFVFHKNHDKYLEKEPVVHKITIGKGLSFAKQNDQRSFILITDAKQIFKFVLNGTSQIDIQKIDKPQDNLNQKLSFYYPEQNFKYPLVVCPNRRLVALGRKNGDILLWESLSSALTNFSSYTLLGFHSDRVTRLLLTDAQMFSVGGQDGLIAQFCHRKYLEVAEQYNLLEEQEEQSQIKPTLTKTEWKESEPKKTVFFKQLQGSTLREGEVEIIGLIQPQKQQNIELKQIIYEILNPLDKINYQSQLKDEQDSQKLVLDIDYVYGINASSRSIYYVHSYPLQNILKKALDQKYWQQLPPQAGKDELQYAKNNLLPLDDDHNACRRQILYCCDRFCVLNQKNMPQQLYKFHRRKISAVAIHPNKQLICSCQVSNTFAELHLWRHQERTTLITLTSKHRSIIIKAEFSRDGEWIATLGGCERAQSIQIFNWENEETVAFRYIEDESINEVQFNPYEKRQLCFAGLGLIRIYRVQQQLIIKEEFRVPEQNFQAIAYTSNIYGSDIESDVITGSLQGDIGLYVCGSFLYSHKKAHERGITCLRLVELFQYKRVLISGGRDGYVRIWDIKFNEISRKNIRDQLFSIKNSSLQMPQTIIISIDIYQCLKKQGGQNNGSALMLIATSDGSILEATITNQFQGYKAVSLVTAETQTLKEKINFDIILYLTAPPSQDSFKSLIFKNLLITYSRKSKFIYFWNMNFKTRQKIIPLANPPLFLSKMKTKSVLLVGSEELSGISLKLYSLEWSAGVYLRSVTPCGEIEMQKNNLIPKGAVFSTLDNKLAVLMRSEDVEEIWVYEKGESSNPQAIQYTIRFRIEQKTTTGLIMRIEWCEFSAKEDGMMVAWNQSKQDSHIDAQIRYKCYDCNNGSNMGMCFYNFEKLDFSAKVKALYLPCFQLTGQNQKDYSSKDSISTTVMTQQGRNLLMGTASGEILVVESEFFARKQSQSKYFAKYYIVGDSPITMLQVKDNDLIAATESGQATFVIKLKSQKGSNKQQLCKDPFSESLAPEDLQKKVKQIYQKRRKIQSEGELVNINCGIDLRLSAVIGRNAFYKRNNIFIDLKDNIITFSGCNLLNMKHETGKRLNQRVIKPDISTNSNHPEISCMILGDCKRFLLIGTGEQNAKIIAWDISTNTNLFDIKLNGFILINLIKLSFSNKHSIVLATAKNGHQYLLFIDLINKGVLAVHHFHRNVQINDLCFALGQQFRILACGTRYMAEWNYCNNLLAEKIFNFTSWQENEENKVENVKGEPVKLDTIFYSLIFIEDYAISSGSDGYLYIWKDEKVVKRQNAHPKQPILSLYTSINSKIFVSGANNGTVIIWHFSSSLIIQKLDEYTIDTGKDIKSPIKYQYQVQSICMTKESLIVGSRAGEIVHFPFSVDPEKLDQETNVTNKIPLPILSACNHEVIKSCAFNASSRKLYVMAEAEGNLGTFSVFDLATLQKIKEQKIELKSSLIRMIACKLSSRLFFVLKSAILIYNYQAEIKDDKYNKLQKGKNFLKCELEIKMVVLNNSQTFLAVLIAAGTLQNAKIEIYNLASQEAQFYALYKTEQNLPASIDIIDFCTDHDYLVYQGADEEQTIIDLMTKERIKVGTLENPPEWNEDAKRTTQYIKQITAFYSEQVKLEKVVQVKNKAVIATDDMGSVRVFAYPIAANKEQNYQVYIEHLNQIYLCVLSPDNRTLVTVSREDRAIHIWEVIHS